MSCSPIGKADDLARYWSHGWNAYSKVLQNAQYWLRNGLMDQLYPMMYFKGNNFYPFAIDWQEQAQGKMIVPGLGIYFMSPREKIGTSMISHEKCFSLVLWAWGTHISEVNSLPIILKGYMMLR